VPEVVRRAYSNSVVVAWFERATEDALENPQRHSVMELMTVKVIHDCTHPPTLGVSVAVFNVAWNTWKSGRKFYFSTYGLSQKGRVVINLSLASSRSL
jgi:hypothetical protein